MSTAAKAGIAIGAVFCVLVAILIAVLLFRRRKRTPQYPPEYSQAPPPMAPAPYAPPPQQPLQVQTTGGASFAASKPEVSPIEEKTPTYAVTRKEVRGGSGVASPLSQGTPVMKHASPLPAHSPAPTEVAGSVPLPRHEVPSDASPGAYQDGGPDGGQGRWVYEVSGSQQGHGQGRDGAFELGSGR
ncbi:hypothetical protein BU23DRAFT_250197 [Bimuria novae-zelandiae CBS 107.79]|uniref:Uncharacterized protein n=1 Tax=Bimuria novae-zelandiae CBS 107.79 TaxID=1447943 RepID=A0A6A5VNG6_9PLEO|nr:hypothetical protein BU23DRAFT_250197 [Bimuria novae-zelandiae CBS 107.79]